MLLMSDHMRKHIYYESLVESAPVSLVSSLLSGTFMKRSPTGTSRAVLM